MKMRAEFISKKDRKFADKIYVKCRECESLIIDGTEHECEGISLMRQIKELKDKENKTPEDYVKLSDLWDKYYLKNEAHRKVIENTKGKEYIKEMEDRLD